VSTLRQITAGLCCLAALVFPFSVAATNVALAGALVTGTVSGRMREGGRTLWRESRPLSISLLAYFALLVLGLGWSDDLRWGLHVLGRQWYWLAIPLMVSVMNAAEWRNRFLMALSLGLTLHLGFCVLQAFGHVTGTIAGGSGVADATGHIGHIGFGFVYGVWAGWLICWGCLRQGMPRYAAWGLAGWAWAMVFSAQGRSGYLIAFLVMVAVIWKYLRVAGNKLPLLALGLFLIFMAASFAGMAQKRMMQTLAGFSAMERGASSKAVAIDERWGLWRLGLEVWKERPWTGVGTGGFPAAAEATGRARPELTVTSSIRPAHPHNMFLLVLARWSVLGIAALGLLLFLWIRTGWRRDWSEYQTAPLIALSGIALAVHGLSSASLEEHFSGVLAALLLGIGLAEPCGRATQPCRASPSVDREA